MSSGWGPKAHPEARGAAALSPRAADGERVVSSGASQLPRDDTGSHPDTSFVNDPDFTLYVGDVRTVLAQLPDNSVDCCVTSPPYWGLRDYGTGQWDGGDPNCPHTVRLDPATASSALRGGKKTTGHQREGYGTECARCHATRVDQQIGLEPTPDQYVAEMVAVFREVRRVLAPHGSCWINLGDSYASGDRDGHGTRVGAKQGTNRASALGLDTLRPPQPASLKPKDLVGIPWRVAFALQQDGWYLRSDIIWSKPNPMPESVTDRPTKAHEYVFLLSKGPRYFFDQEAVREPAEWARWGDQTNAKHEGSGSAAGWITSKSKGELQRPQARRAMELFEQAGLTEEHARAIRAVGITDTGKATVTQNGTGKNDQAVLALAQEAKEALGGYYREFLVPNGRNVRSVWEIATQPYPEAHFATFPEQLPERCIKAGCPEWVCRVCGKPRERIVERGEIVAGYRASNTKGYSPPRENSIGREWSASPLRDAGKSDVQTLGWSDCGHDNYRPGVVLDPFIGSGTTALVARRLGRHAIGVELNEEYAALAARRLQQLSLLA